MLQERQRGETHAQGQAEAIARAGRALVRSAMTMEAIYGYMAEVLAASSRLLSYPPEEAISTPRVSLGVGRPQGSRAAAGRGRAGIGRVSRHAHGSRSRERKTGEKKRNT